MPEKKFLCIQRSTPGSACEKPSPSDMEKMYEVFHRWQQQFGDKIVDMGGALASDGRVVTADKTLDGPFVEAKEIVGGYMIISADSYEEAAEIVRQSPGTAMPGSSVEIREITQH